MGKIEKKFPLSLDYYNEQTCIKSAPQELREWRKDIEEHITDTADDAKDDILYEVGKIQLSEQNIKNRIDAATDVILNDLSETEMKLLNQVTTSETNLTREANENQAAIENAETNLTREANENQAAIENAETNLFNKSEITRNEIFDKISNTETNLTNEINENQAAIENAETNLTREANENQAAIENVNKNVDLTRGELLNKSDEISRTVQERIDLAERELKSNVTDAKNNINSNVTDARNEINKHVTDTVGHAQTNINTNTDKAKEDIISSFRNWLNNHFNK